MITKKTSIAEMNEVIALFMGGKRILHPSQKHFSEDHFGYVCHDGRWWNENNLKYHTSWDWLMPVVEKIENVALDNKGGFILRSAAQVKIYYQACRIIYTPDEESGDNNEEIIIQTKGRTKIEAVHKAVFKFIQWFNQQHKTNDK